MSMWATSDMLVRLAVFTLNAACEYAWTALASPDGTGQCLTGQVSLLIQVQLIDISSSEVLIVTEVSQGILHHLSFTKVSFSSQLRDVDPRGVVDLSRS